MRSIKELTGLGVKAGDVWMHEFEVQVANNASNYIDFGLAGQLDELAKIANPPSSNTGGTYPETPPFFPHGEKNHSIVIKNKTKLDWLAFTTVGNIDEVIELLRVIWPDLIFSRNPKGFYGYPVSYAITNDGVPYGIYCCEAKTHNRNYVSLDGTACKTLTDELVDIFHEALSIEKFEVQLSRVDLALDFYRGEITWDHAYWAYHQGRFMRPFANKNPDMTKIGGISDGKNAGRTMNVGKRGGHVMVRVYEKGLEVYAKLPDELRLLSQIRQDDKHAELVAAARAAGEPEPITPEFEPDTWVRLEAEYKSQGKELPLPLEMMLKRDQYFAGANPYFESALGRSELAGIRPQHLKTESQVDLEVMLNNGQRSYGSVIETLLHIGLTEQEIVSRLRSGKLNERLVKAGVIADMKGAVQVVRKKEQDWDIPF